MNFRVGQKVVCVEDAWVGASPLAKGNVYTVVGFSEEMVTCYAVTGELVSEASLFLKEAVNNFGNGVVGFSHRRFRPIVKRKADISIFKAMLADKKVRVSA